MTNRFKKMCELYKIFVSDFDYDFSDNAMQYAYVLESTGVWNTDSLYTDKKYLNHHDWLNSVFGFDKINKEFERRLIEICKKHNRGIKNVR